MSEKENGHGVVSLAELARLLTGLSRTYCVSSEKPGGFLQQWADGGATGQIGGAGIHITGAKSSSLSLRPPGLPLALISEDGNIVWSGI